MILDFFVRKSYYIDHLAPLWNLLPEKERGRFYLPVESMEYARARLKKPALEIYEPEKNYSGANPVITCGYGDAVKAHIVDGNRFVVLMEHGVGLTFGKASYANGVGQRGGLSMFPLPSQYVADKFPVELAHKPHPVVGIPKLDKWAGTIARPMSAKPVIGIAFHHGNSASVPPEVGSAWEYYADCFKELARRYKVLGHAHPIAGIGALEAMEAARIEITYDFDDIMRRADIYVNDCSSTLYEFLVTGNPVIILNAPQFRRSVTWGLRFWDYTNVGPMVENGRELFAAIDKTIAAPELYRESRKRAVIELFPNLGRAAEATLNAVRAVLEKTPITVTLPQPMTAKACDAPTFPAPVIRKSEQRGIIYMAFGDKARAEMAKSVASLRATGSTLPVCVIGDKESRGNGVRFIKWTGESPFDCEQTKNFQFRAGRVKPGLYAVSPFKQTMYIDCDTLFRTDPEICFDLLKNWDFVATQEILTVSRLYNQPRAGWQHNMDERDATITEIGAKGDFHFWNSGVFFWRQGPAAKGMFELWSSEWKRWAQWDEQLALMRAAHKSKARIFVLSEDWNCPRDEARPWELPAAKNILHLYGRGTARINIEKEKENV